MAKVKNKRNSGLADKVHNKRKQDNNNKKKLNPFEVHINREKIKVLGKKSKHDRGLPGVARAKAIKKRKETLGTEMKLMNKTNTFIDRRIGEKDNQLSAEDRMVARFAAERAKQHSKKNMYNLADDEILTHRGQTLEQIEKFDDPRSSDDEEGENKKFGGLDDEFVSEGHFGGGILSRTESKDGAKSHKDLIEQLIAESKKRKAEKQKEKEQTFDLTEKLDSEWKDLQPVVFKKARVEEESIIDKLLSQAEKKHQDYDMMMRSLKFERRGTPSDGLKSDEKQAKEDREKLEQWERERQQRMMPDDVAPSRGQQPTTKHRSADDLDDNFELDDEKEFMLAYDKDGKPLVPESILKDFSVPNAKPKFNDGISDSSDDENNDNDDHDENDENIDDESDEEHSHKNDRNQDSDEHSSVDEVTKSMKLHKKTKKSDTENEEDDSESSSDEEDNKKTHKEKRELGEIKNRENVNKGKDKSILHVNNSEDSSNEGNYDKANINDKKAIKNKNAKNVNGADNSKDNPNEIINKKSNKNDTKVASKNIKLNKNDSEDSDSSDEDSGNNNDDDESDDNVDNLKDLKESEESADEMETEEDIKKIGSFFDLKLAEGDNLQELLSGKSPAQQSVALDKLIKRYDPSLGENNKDLLSRLFAHMLQYINDIFTNLQNEGNVIKAFLTFDRLVPHLFDLANTNKVSTKKFLVELLKEKHDIYQKNPKRIPDLDTLIFFKLVSLLYPTSDFRHPVTTPSMVFMSEILTRCRFNDAYSVSRGLLVTSLILEFTALSKRLVPSAINFIRGIIYLCANTSILNPIQVVPPFRLHKDSKILNLEDDCSKMAVDNKMAAKDLTLKEIDNDFKIRCLIVSTCMLKDFFNYFNDLEAQECMFEPHIKLLGRVDLDLYPKKVASVVSKIVQHMKESLEMKTYTHLAREKKKPKALRLYEPDIQEVFTGSKSSKLSREMADRARLKTKYKRAMKGALREIRRDKAYIASVKLRQKIYSDKIRKEKVKQIYKDASIQQGELNKLKKMK